MSAVSGAAGGPYGEPAPSAVLGPTVAAVLEAHRTGDWKALTSRAARTDPDPWVVVDALLVRGERDAAAAFAAAAEGKDHDGLPAFLKALRSWPARPEARAALDRAKIAWHAKDFEAALAALEGVQAPGHPFLEVEIHSLRGSSLGFLSRHDACAPALRSAAEQAEKLGWLARAAVCWRESGHAAAQRGDLGTAHAAWTRQRAVEERRGNVEGLAMVLGNLGLIHAFRAEFALSLELQQEALKRRIEIGRMDWAGESHSNIGALYLLVGDLPRALDHFERSLAILEDLGNDWAAAKTLGNLGVVNRRLGRVAEAYRIQERTLDRMRAVENRHGEAVTLRNLGALVLETGAVDRAIALLREAIPLLTRRQARAELSGAHAMLARALAVAGNAKEARRHLDLAGRVGREIDDPYSRAGRLLLIADLELRWHQEERAEAVAREALDLAESIGADDEACSSRALIGGIARRRGDPETALRELGAALETAERIGSSDTILECRRELGTLHLARGDLTAADRWARSAVAALESRARGLAEEQGARLRSGERGVFELGMDVALARKDPIALAFFLEKGRAGTLLESLGGREALLGVALDPELEDAERSARARLAEARERHRRALRTRRVKPVRECREALDRAETQLMEVVERIQREAKAAANLLHHGVEDLASIEGRLRANEVLVAYVLTPRKAAALVVRRTGSRIVALADPGEIARAAGDLRSHLTSRRGRGLDLESGPSPRGGLGEARDALRRLVVEPLGLRDEDRRVLLSPAGALGEVPFVLLIPGRETVHVPSATAYGVLLADRPKHGRQVLGLGDPVYGPEAGRSPLRGSGGDRLSPLPATRPEVEAIADVKLLGERASEAAFRKAVRKRPRWRAVHLACHGLVDRDRAMLSSLAMTPDGENDGRLTCQEVMRMAVPADLVVLSACETGRGRTYASEGVLGLVRAFMLAGSPRVVGSLWRVDDEATRALMVRFYELWNPETGPGLGAATALRQAQEHVRSQSRWSHPRFWAAWVLWGLPD